jgi:hypothetical protein
VIIGLDLDNTIVCYDECFHSLAVEGYGMPECVPVSKGEVRRFFREAGREPEWTLLQGVVYGDAMQKAEAFEGALAFVREAAGRGRTVKIISHRTRHPIAGNRTDLHQAALQWLRRGGFVGKGGVDDKNVFFETTKEGKLDRIRSEGCALFLDDLPEILDAELFPDSVQDWLFHPGPSAQLRERVVADWNEFARKVL